MTYRIAALSDVHGNAVALAAVRGAIKKAKPDAVLVAGDHVLNGPEPAAAVDALRELEADGALIVQGNTDIAVADFDYGAAFPWFTDGVPDSIRYAAEWAHDALGDERLDWLRRLPAERRLRLEETFLLVDPRLAGLPDRRLRSASRSIGRHRADVPDRRPAHRLRAHPPARASATSAGSRSSTTARPATSSTATRPPRGRSSSSTARRSASRSSAPSSTSSR